MRNRWMLLLCLILRELVERVRKLKGNMKGVWMKGGFDCVEESPLIDAGDCRSAIEEE
ncbi:hypothetical protein HanRHA438_Chr14g0668981 [Helianthus annuus]|nr:hypothetical protein HanRHA438_Chr14g0668981 [Helianthus annuus]